MSCSEQRPTPNPRMMPIWNRQVLVRETYRAIMRIRENDPELWARLEKRAAEIRKERAME